MFGFLPKVPVIEVLYFSTLSSSLSSYIVQGLVVYYGRTFPTKKFSLLSRFKLLLIKNYPRKIGPNQTTQRLSERVHALSINRMASFVATSPICLVRDAEE